MRLTNFSNSGLANINFSSYQDQVDRALLSVNLQDQIDMLTALSSTSISAMTSVTLAGVNSTVGTLSLSLCACSGFKSNVNLHYLLFLVVHCCPQLMNISVTSLGIISTIRTVNSSLADIMNQVVSKFLLLCRVDYAIIVLQGMLGMSANDLSGSASSFTVSRTALTYNNTQAIFITDCYCY